MKINDANGHTGRPAEPLHRRRPILILELQKSFSLPTTISSLFQPASFAVVTAKSFFCLEAKDAVRK